MVEESEDLSWEAEEVSGTQSMMKRAMMDRKDSLRADGPFPQLLLLKTVYELVQIKNNMGSV